MSGLVRAAVAGLCLSLSGCAWFWHDFYHHELDQDDETYVPMPVSNLSQRLVNGDVIRIRTKEGKLHRFRVAEVADKAFTGVATNSKSYRVPYKTISEIWIRRL